MMVMQDEVVEGVEILLGREWTPYDVLTKALVEGMTIVGIDFRDGILFVPEVLMAANAMKVWVSCVHCLQRQAHRVLVQWLSVQ